MKLIETSMLLTVGLAEKMPASAEYSVQAAQSGREALQLARVINFDLLVAGTNVTDMGLWPMIQRIRRQSHQLKWILVDERLTTADQVEAWSNGVLAIFDQTPNVEEMEQLLAPSVRSMAGAGY